ncbi:hypothetical protein Q1695_007338 [Nippostrongylus brasiliensis]|nr:hypothetical protein Q1695_007338 [Nippostrongylus brasiliensis]
MSDAAPSSSPAPVKKAKAVKPKGEKKPKVAPAHPVYAAMIKAAIKDLKDRKGASKQAIFKFISQKYKVGDNEKQINARLRTALKRGVATGALSQATGSGAAGRFRIAEKAAAAPKPKIAKKPKAASPKKAAAKPKKAAADKPKKAAKSPKKPKSPKKAAAAKPKKAAKSPKKPAAKKAAKKPAAKKA